MSRGGSVGLVMVISFPLNMDPLLLSFLLRLMVVCEAFLMEQREVDGTNV